MNSKLLLNNHNLFETRIDRLIAYADDIADPVQQGARDRSNLEQRQMLAEGLLLRACALWESFIDREVILLIALDPERLVTEFELPKETKLNIKLIRAIVFSDMYRDFNGIEHSKVFFKKVINKNFNAFEVVTREQIRKLAFTYKLRNYLSHHSDFAKRKLFADYKSQFSYTRFVEPGDFLLRQQGKQFERHVHNLKLMSVTMQTYLKRNI